MRLVILSLGVVLLATGVQAQKSPVERLSIPRAQRLAVSSIDRTLPKVSLKFFLNYEAGGSTVDWEVTDCGERSTTARDCAQASFQVNHRMATIVVSVGKSRAGFAESPSVLAVTITEIDGTTHPLRQLGDLPRALNRPASRMPRDLPNPMGTGSFGGTGVPREAGVSV